MRNSIGTNIILTLFGESHGECVGAVLDGLAPGIEVDEEFISAQLSLRRPSGPCETSRSEKDRFSIVSGVFNGRTTGAPVCIIIPNEDCRSNDYVYGLPRPSHADYPAHIKYKGYEDYRGGGHFSGRITAGIVAEGAIVLQALEKKGISVGSHILSCGGVNDIPFSQIEDELKALKGLSFPVISDVSAQMETAIDLARQEGDSVGGIVQTAVAGLPAGIGEPWFDSLEGSLSRAIFALGGVKGIEFGSGFALAGMRGSAANDPLCCNDGVISTLSNHNGGINGGISNGMPIVFNTAVKPTPSISKEQQTVNLSTGENSHISIKGRHDPAIVRRICPVINALTAIVLYDLIAVEKGADWLTD